MELFVRIAAFDAGQRCFCKRGFDLHDLGGFGLGRVRFVSEQLEHLRNVGDVLVADGNGPVVALGVIVAVGQAEAAGFGESDYILRILEVLVGTEVKEQAVGSQRGVQTGQQRGQILRRLHGRDLIEIRLQRLGAEPVDGGLVHTGAEVVADLLLVRVAAGGLFGKLVENSPKELLIVLIKLAVDAPARLVGGDGIVLHPSTAGVLVEIDARIGGFIHGGDVEPWCVREGSERFFGLRRSGHGGAASKEDEEQSFHGSLHRISPGRKGSVSDGGTEGKVRGTRFRTDS